MMSSASGTRARSLLDAELDHDLVVEGRLLDVERRFPVADHVEVDRRGPVGTAPEVGDDDGLRAEVAVIDHDLVCRDRSPGYQRSARVLHRKGPGIVTERRRRGCAG